MLPEQPRSHAQQRPGAIHLASSTVTCSSAAAGSYGEEQQLHAMGMRVSVAPHSSWARPEPVCQHVNRCAHVCSTAQHHVQRQRVKMCYGAVRCCISIRTALRTGVAASSQPGSPAPQLRVAHVCASMTRIIRQQRHSVGSFLATHEHAWDGPRPNASLPRRSSVSLAAMRAAAHCHLHAFAFVLPPNRAWGSNAGTLCFSCPRLHDPRKMGPSLGAVAGGLAFKLGCASVSIAGARAGVVAKKLRRQRIALWAACCNDNSA